jgi:signal transduction histidine kinase
MSAEPIIAFFLVLNVRKILRNADQQADWEKPIKMILFGIVSLFLAGLIFHLDYLTKWIWDLFLFGIIGFAFLRTEFSATRTLMYAVMPFAVVSFSKNVFEALNIEKWSFIDAYLKVGAAFSIVWLVAMVIVSRRQQKALRKEQSKTRQEEEQRKWMAIRKEELEKIVSERTSELRQQKEQVEQTLSELKATQAQLIQSEKMASLGELTAGIAHEIQNPLNFVNNFSEVNTELITEMNQAIEKGNFEEVKEISKDIEDNEKKIIFHGKRADAIVKGMLQHSRRSAGGEKEPTDINALADEYLRLAYHGLRAKDKTFNATMKTEFDETIGNINVIPQDIGRAILNLITNAFYAVSERKKMDGEGYEPTVIVGTKKTGNTVLIKVQDNGNGIPQKIVDKIFQPFFTTKPTGQGTGLGLSLSYDIVKAHGGEIKVDTKEGEGTIFIISLSLKSVQ